MECTYQFASSVINELSGETNKAKYENTAETSIETEDEPHSFPLIY